MKQKDVISLVNSFLGDDNFFDEIGCAFVKFGEGIHMACFAQEGRLSCCLPLFQMPNNEKDSNAMLEKAMFVSRYQLNTRGGAIALTFDNQTFVYCANVEMVKQDGNTIDKTDFSNFISNMIEQSYFLKEAMKISSDALTV